MPVSVARSSGDGRRALALAALAFTIYNANLRLVVEGDSRPARLLPFAIWHAGSLTLDSLPDLAQAVEKSPHYHTPYWLWRSPGGHLLSVYPVVTPVLVAPLYAPAAAALWLRGWDTRRIAAWAPALEKLAASSLCALTVGLFYLLLRRRPAGSDLQGVPAMEDPPADLPGVPAMVDAPADLQGVPAMEDPPADLPGVPAMVDAPADLQGAPARVDTPAAGNCGAGGHLARRDATLLTLALAFGTGTWPISSQALWTHGAGELLAVLALLAITRLAAPVGGEKAISTTIAARSGVFPTSRRWLLLAAGAGAACGLMVANRPPDGILAAALLGYLALSLRWRSVVAFAAAVAAAAPVAWYNEHYFGLLAGGYGVMGLAGPHPFYRHSMLLGALGLLVSPAKGLLLFSPFLLFVPAAFLRARRAAPVGAELSSPPAPTPTNDARGGARAVSDRRLAVCVLAGCLAQLLFYGLSDWRGGSCYGPRFLADAMPLCVWLLLPALPRLDRRWRRLLIASLLASVVIQAIGAFCYPMGGSDDVYYPRGQEGVAHLRISPGVWQPQNAAFLLEARGGLAPPSLLPRRFRGQRGAQR
jgi:hypothetical protein